MEINSAKSAAAETAGVTAAVAEQASRFNQRKSIEAQSDVKNEAVFFSPVIKIDAETHTAVIQYRDSTTGAVERQYPDNVKVGAYEHAQDTTSTTATVSAKSGIISIIGDSDANDDADAQTNASGDVSENSSVASSDDQQIQPDANVQAAVQAPISASETQTPAVDEQA